MYFATTRPKNAQSALLPVVDVAVESGQHLVVCAAVPFGHLSDELPARVAKTVGGEAVGRHWGAFEPERQVELALLTCPGDDLGLDQLDGVLARALEAEV